MNAKSTPSRIALTMFCAGALSFGMAPAAMADELPAAPEAPTVSATTDVVADASQAGNDAPIVDATQAAEAAGTELGDADVTGADDAALADTTEGESAPTSPEGEPAEVAPAVADEPAPAAPAAEVAQPWAASTSEPDTFPMPAAAPKAVSDRVLVSAVGDQGWKKTVPDFGHGTDGAFTVQFTDNEVVFSDPDAYVDMGLYKTGLDLGIAEVSESHVEGRDAHLRLIGSTGRWGQTPVEVTFDSDSSTATLRIGQGRDAVTTSGLTAEQLRANPDLASVRFTSAEVGYKNTAEPQGHTATVRSVTIGGTTTTFHAQREMVYVGQAGDAGWNTVRPAVVGTPGNPAEYASTATFNGQGVVFSDPDARVWMGLRKTGLNVELSTAANVELTGMNDAHLRLTGRGPSGNAELTFLPGPDSNVIVRVGGVSTTQTRDELRANPQLQGVTFTTAEVGYKNTAEPAGREVWVGAVTIGNTDYVFHADPTVTFRNEEELEQSPMPEPTPQLPMQELTTVLNLGSPELEQSPMPEPTPQLPMQELTTVLNLGSPELEQSPMPEPTPQLPLPQFTVTYSLPMTSLTPANTVSRPVEVPQAPAEKPAGDAQVEGTEDVAETAAGTPDTADELAHTGAEETAALAALALALMGTGITLVGLKRRQAA